LLTDGRMEGELRSPIYKEQNPFMPLKKTEDTPEVVTPAPAPEKTTTGAVPITPPPGTKFQTTTTTKFEGQVGEQKVRPTLTPEQQAAVKNLNTRQIDERITDLAEFVSFWKEYDDEFIMLVERLPDALMRPGQASSFARPVTTKETLGVFPFVKDVSELINDLRLANRSSGGRFRILLLNEESEPLTEYTPAGEWIGTISDAVQPANGNAPANGNGYAPKREKTLKEQIKELREMQEDLEALGLNKKEDNSPDSAMLSLFKDSGVLAAGMTAITTSVATAVQKAAEVGNATTQPETMKEKIINRVLNDERVLGRVFGVVDGITSGIFSVFGGRKEKRIEKEANSRTEDVEQDTKQEYVRKDDILDFLMDACEANTPVNVLTSPVLLEYQEKCPKEYARLIANLRIYGVDILKAGFISLAKEDGRDGRMEKVLALEHADAFIQHMKQTAKERKG
jgi:hypothetical protein